MFTADDPARIDTAIDSRSISFENPTGERGRGGASLDGRKGSPQKLIFPGQKLTLANIQGPGCIRHIWMTFPPARPEQMRAVWLEVFYDDLEEPSISAPCLDFFGLPHGRAVAYFSALTSVQEGRGFNAYYPMPFHKKVRFELTNSGSAPIAFYYQIDYSLQPLDPQRGYLHVAFRRENPTRLKQDFVIAHGFKGPGRFLGSAIGIRVLNDGMYWYGEGEFKVYRDGDEALPTICGTGLEDYVGSGWGMAKHTAPYAGAPINVAPEKKPGDLVAPGPDYVGFYRWHLPDPIIFASDIKVTIQQIGNIITLRESEHKFDGVTLAGAKRWEHLGPGSGFPALSSTIAERQDDYCATAFVYCQRPQAVPRLDIKAATGDIALRPYEKVPSLI